MLCFPRVYRRSLRSVTIQKATPQYFPVVLLIILYKVVVTCESLGQILKCDHSKESYLTVLSGGAVYYTLWA